MTTEQEITDAYNDLIEKAYDSGYADGYDRASFRPERWIEEGCADIYRTGYNDGYAARKGR